MKRGWNAYIFVVLLFLLEILWGYSYAQDIYVQPNETDTSIGESFNVDIMVRDVTGLSTFEFRISFDKDILEGTSLAKGSLWNDPDYLWHAGSIDNASGNIGFTSGSASSGSEPLGVSVDASGGVLATITFQAIAKGTGPIGLTDVLVYDIGGSEITVNTVNGTVNSLNRPPVADNQSVTTDEDTPVGITLTGSDPDGDPFTYTVVSNPSNGSLSGAAPDVTYTPDPDHNSSDSFTFKVNDGTIDSNIATVSITVNPVNDPPMADDQSVTTSEDTPVGITLTGSDPDGDPLIYTVVSNPSNGSLSGTAPDVTYTPNAGFSGSDSFTFKVNDGTVDSNIATVSISVDSVNDPPMADDQSVTTSEDTPVGITLTGSDPDGDPLTYTVVSNPSDGSLSGTAPNLTYTPNPDHNSSDSFTFKVNDGTVDSNIATVSITVNPVNDPPVADDQSVTTSEDIPVGIMLTGSDTDGDTLTYTLVSNPSNGSLSGTAPSLTYTPNADHNSSDSFTFKVNDGTIDSNIATVSITVNPVNDSPVADDQSVTTSEDTPVGITLTGSDPDGDPITYTVVSNPSNGSLSGTAPDVTYTPDPDHNSSDSFTFKVNDGTVDSNIATVSITVVSLNDPPMADHQSVTTTEDTSVPILLTGSDPDGDPLTCTVVSNPSNGLLSGTAPNLTYTPNAGFSGNDSLTFKVNDGTVDSNIATVSITVEPLEDVSTMVQVNTTNSNYDDSGSQLSMLATWTNISTSQLSKPLLMVVEKIKPSSIRVVNADGTTPVGKPYYDYSNSVGDGKLEPEEMSEARQIVLSGPGSILTRMKFTFDVSCWAHIDGSVADSMIASSTIAVNPIEAPGWSLISLPVQPSDTDPRSVLSSIDGKYNSVWAYDPNMGWSTYAPGAPSDLQKMKPGEGYWVKMQKQGTLMVQGNEPNQTRIRLKGGAWNLVGYSSQENRSAEECMSQVADAIDAVWQYDPETGWSKYTPDGVSDLGDMEPGYGYWIEANRDCIWDVNAIAPAAAPPLTVKSRSSHVSVNTPGMPYRIWGDIEIDGVKMMDERVEANAPVVILKVDGRVYSSYTLGSVESYGDSYVLDVPADVTNSAQAEILVQVGDKIVESGLIPSGRPGQVLRFDLSIKFSPKASMLHQNYPNPLNPETWIPYELSEASNVQIEIYSLSGQLVRMLDLGYKQSGFYKRREDAAYWDGRNGKGEKVASGIYFYTIKAGGFSATTRKMTVLR